MWLDVVKHICAGGDWSTFDVHVDLVVHLQLKGEEETTHSSIVIVIATTWHAPVNAEAEWRPFFGSKSKPV